MRAFLIVPVMAGLALAAPHLSSPSTRFASVVANDNRRAAGTMAHDTLSASFTVQMAHWAPEGDHHRQVDVAAMTEDGKAPSIPAPLLRVKTGTVMKVRVRNALGDSTIKIFGLWSHPYEGKDTTAIAPGKDHEFVFTAGAPGTYLYGARIGNKYGRNLGDPERETALGAFVVDSAGPVPPDRIFVINIFSDSTGNALAINGNSWPGTERLNTTVGDTLRWRWVNATIRPHPMHLHGFYFTLLSKGDSKGDTVYAANKRMDEVTDRMRNMSTMTMQWSPNRPGNWLFHCHIAFHVIPEAAQLQAPDSTHDETHSANADEHMRGLIVGIKVDPKKGAKAESRANAMQLALSVEERTPRADKRRRMEYKLAGAPAGDSNYVSTGPALILEAGRPTDVAVTNRLKEATSVHWHGIELESYSDGVAGWSGMGNKTAPMIAPGETFRARLSLPRPGTFMYHTHLGDLAQLTAGLHGPIIVMPKGVKYDPRTDHVYLAHVDGPEDLPFIRVNGDSTPRAPLRMKVGETHRLRFIDIMAALDMWYGVERDTVPMQWTPLAKDGADFPVANRMPTAARMRIAAGETRDYLFTPTEPGEYRLRATVDLRLPGWVQKIIVTP